MGLDIRKKLEVNMSFPYLKYTDFGTIEINSINLVYDDTGFLSKFEVNYESIREELTLNLDLFKILKNYTSIDEEFRLRCLDIIPVLFFALENNIIPNCTRFSDYVKNKNIENIMGLADENGDLICYEFDDETKSFPVMRYSIIQRLNGKENIVLDYFKPVKESSVFLRFDGIQERDYTTLIRKPEELPEMLDSLLDILPIIYERIFKNVDLLSFYKELETLRDCSTSGINERLIKIKQSDINNEIKNFTRY